ncbi:hypothetical protein ACFOUO_07550 [Salinithrix halophila]|uniref:Uncharacterized protein n=2 Tax=Salinithrix halophila TaxID=1485204 RepID=A0ABV8JIN7_9BACL
MEVYGFYGVSGSGKSSKALLLAHRMGIPAIIDDGLLILHGQKIAGVSAKYELNRIAAIKRAIFFDSEHAQRVRAAITANAIDKLLVLGTSLNMIDRIVDVLELPRPIRWIAIDEVATAKEIQYARYIRHTEGQHVIPVPKIEVERNLLSKWVGKAQSVFAGGKSAIGETTVVFPPFQLGRVTIRESCIRDIVYRSCCQVEGLSSIRKVVVNPRDGHVTVHVRLAYGKHLMAVCRKIQYHICAAFERMQLYSLYPPQIVMDDLRVPERLIEHEDTP